MRHQNLIRDYDDGDGVPQHVVVVLVPDDAMRHAVFLIHDVVLQHDCCADSVLDYVQVLQMPQLKRKPHIQRRLVFFSCFTPLSVITIYQK